MGAIAALIVAIGIVCIIYGFMERAKAQRVTGAPLLKTGEIEGQAGGAAVSKRLDGGEADGEQGCRPWGSHFRRVRGKARERRPRGRTASLQCPVSTTRGRVSNWWYGGGEDRVHSSVVAPSPHGLSAAFSLRMKE